MLQSIGYALSNAGSPLALQGTKLTAQIVGAAGLASKVGGQFGVQGLQLFTFCNQGVALLLELAVGRAGQNIAFLLFFAEGGRGDFGD